MLLDCQTNGKDNTCSCLYKQCDDLFHPIIENNNNNNNNNNNYNYNNNYNNTWLDKLGITIRMGFSAAENSFVGNSKNVRVINMFTSTIC